GHPLADGHALSILAAGPAALVDDEVVPDHLDGFEHLGAVADDVHVLDGAGELAILDEVAVAHVEGEVARSDLHGAVGEDLAIDAPVHAADDLLCAVLAGLHVGGAHPWDHRVTEALPAPRTRGRDPI